MRLGKTAILVPLFALSACDRAEPEAPETAPVEDAASAEEFAEEIQALPAQPDFSPAPEGALTDWLVQNFDFEELSYQTAEYDLDADGNPELLVHLSGSSLCVSSGCSLFILQYVDGDFDILGNLTDSHLPVGVFPESRNGWQDLAVTIGGGDVASAVARVPFVGTAYASNPAEEPAEISLEEFELLIGASFDEAAE